jgi:hypothetical protein
LLAAICGGQAAYSVWQKENDAKNKIEAESTSLRDKLTPTIDISVNSNGIVEEKDRNGNPLTKRVQIIVKSLTDTPLIECQTEIDRVERLDVDGSIMILDEPLRVEWGNVDEGEKFGKVTIPAGAEKRVNLFVMPSVSTGHLEPVIPHPKQEFMEGISQPGKYKVSVLVSSLSTNAARQQFILKWSSYKDVTLHRCPSNSRPPSA